MLYFEKDSDSPDQYHVAVSEVYFSAKRTLKCVLGSCVSVVLFSKKLQETYSSMSHYLLDLPLNHSPEPEKDRDKYGYFLLHQQLDHMLKRVNQVDLRAMIFGGAGINNVIQNKLIQDIGLKNIEIARKIMHDFSIPVVAENCGFHYSRHVEFYPLKRTALLKIIENNEIHHYPFRE